MTGPECPLAGEEEGGMNTGCISQWLSSLEQRGHAGDQGFGLILNLQQAEVSLEHLGADMMVDWFDPTPSFP